MIIDQYRVQARYNAWINAKLYDATATLEESERTQDLRAFFGSIHATLNHILLADLVWLGRLTGDRERFSARDADGNVIRPTGLGHVLYADFGLLRQRREELDKKLSTFIDGLDTDWLQGTMAYANTDGSKRNHPRWWAVGHMLNHQTHHRGQVSAMLTRLGKDPGVTDMLVMQWEQH